VSSIVAGALRAPATAATDCPGFEAGGQVASRGASSGTVRPHPEGREN